MPRSAITPALLVHAGAQHAHAAVYAPAIADACVRRGVASRSDIANLLAQIMNESGNLTCVHEVMSYTSAARLRAVFPSHFHSTAAALPYVRRPRKLGNFVYARLGGYERRGAGLAQVTGTDNFTRYAADIGMALAKVAAHMTAPAGAADSAVWFFVQAGCRGLAGPREVRCRWAGMPAGSAPIGLPNVTRLYALFARALGITKPSAATTADALNALYDSALRT